LTKYAPWFSEFHKKGIKTNINLDIKFLWRNICAHKVQTLTEMLSRKVEG
jgi:hypothetical protein